MKTMMPLAAAGAALLFSTAATAQIAVPATYELRYNPEDGSLSIATFDGPLYTYSIKTTGDPSLDDGFVEENHILLPDAPGGLEDPRNNSEDDELSQSDFDAWNGLGAFSLGQVLPSGLTESEFNAIVDMDSASTFYVDELGAGAFKEFDIVFVPEPTSLVLLGIGVAMLAQRRRGR
ncbi:MAG: PEP-CTERM sorting domain-containing protein [Phycisphaeraceae bacterium]